MSRLTRTKQFRDTVEKEWTQKGLKCCMCMNVGAIVNPGSKFRIFRWPCYKVHFSRADLGIRVSRVTFFFPPKLGTHLCIVWIGGT